MTGKRKWCYLTVAENRKIIRYIDGHPTKKNQTSRIRNSRKYIGHNKKNKDKLSGESGLAANSRRLKSWVQGHRGMCWNYQKTWQRIREKFNLQETEFEELVTFDDDLAVCRELTDDEIFTCKDISSSYGKSGRKRGRREWNYTLVVKKMAFIKKGWLSDGVVNPSRNWIALWIW